MSAPTSFPQSRPPASAGRSVGQQMLDLCAELYPICRSITGNGVRQTLAALQRQIPMEIRETPTGTPALDWTVPKEWNIRDAYVKDASGKRVIDFQASCLHVMGYSIPVKGRFTLAELKPRLFTIPEHPDWIPFRYSYYNEDWAFCLAHKELEKLKDGEYEVMIDSTLEDGSLSYGEFYLPGKSSDEILVSTHVDHPAMGNDNLSGIAVTTYLAERLALLKERRYSYRFIFIPTTIGSITWLSQNKENLDRIKAGFVVTCVGDAGGFTWKETRRGNTDIDRAFKCALRESGEKYELGRYTPFGFDERQFTSPGFNLPIGVLFRTYGIRPSDRLTYSNDYPEKHTSADNMDLLSAEKLEGSLALCEKVVAILEGNAKYINTKPYAEPQLGKYGIYRKIGGPDLPENLHRLFWILNQSDGEHSLLDIVEKSDYRFADIRETADLLIEQGLLTPANSTDITSPAPSSVG